MNLTPHDLSMLPPGHQVAMAGDDWLSERDHKSKAKAEAARKKAAIACAKKLDAAAEALHELVMACMECDDGSTARRADDGRYLLQRDIREFAGWLQSVYGK